MDKFSRYMESIDFVSLTAITFLFFLAYSWTPSRNRVLLLVVVSIVWMSLSRYTGLGVISSASKLTCFIPHLFICFECRNLSGALHTATLPAKVMLLTCLVGFFFISGVTDFVAAFGYQVGLVAICASSLSLSYFASRNGRWDDIWRAVCIGFGISSLVAGTALIVAPSEAFRPGVWRFTPYGANGNQAGTLFIVFIPLGLYFTDRSKSVLVKALYGVSVALVAGLALITISRSVVFFSLICSVPVMLKVGSKPVLGLILLALVSVGIALVSRESVFLESRVDRLGNLDTTRDEIASNYLEGVILDRPITGLMFTTGLSVDHAPGLTQPHNAYLRSLYFGGAIYTLPIVIVLLAGLNSALHLYRKKWGSYFEQPVPVVVLLLYVATVVHGFIGVQMHHPTDAWAFFHFISLFSILRCANAYMLGYLVSEDRSAVVSCNPNLGIDRKW